MSKGESHLPKLQGQIQAEAERDAALDLLAEAREFVEAFGRSFGHARTGPLLARIDAHLDGAA